MEPFESLANAIIELAVKDYKDDLLYLMEHKPIIPEDADDVNYRKHMDSKADLERFFHSGWFQTLSDLDGEYLMKRIQKIMNWEET